MAEMDVTRVAGYVETERTAEIVTRVAAYAEIENTKMRVTRLGAYIEVEEAPTGRTYGPATQVI